MTSGFDANVPARKPRTKIARVVSELTSGQQNGAADREERPAADHTAPAAHDAAADARRDFLADYQENNTPGAPVSTDAQTARVGGPSAAPANETATTASPARGGREQLARLRERLAATDHVWSTAAEPKRMATAVRETVDGLRERIEASVRERSELAEALEEARAALARTGADLQKERRAREALEAQADERRSIADDAVAEAEALAAERDQVLGELAEHRRVEEEQTSVLADVEAALNRRDAEREAVARELAEARDQIDLRAAEIADLEARLQTETAGRARAEAKCRELEAEVARLSEARDALESIEATLGYRRENQGGDTS